MQNAASDPQSIIAELEQKLRAQAADITRLEKQSRSLERKNQSLESAKRELFEQLRLLIENRFGPSSEKCQIPQEDLFFDEAEALGESESASESDEAAEEQSETPTKPASAKPRTRGGRVALPPELPRVDIVHDVADDQKHCHNDGAELVCIGEEISEQLDPRQGPGDPSHPAQVCLQGLRRWRSPYYMWVQRGGPPGQQVVLYDYDASRSGQVPTRLLENYQGILVTDGYEAYTQVVRTNHLTHVGCWAHARRKFVEAHKVQPKGKVGRADQALSLIRSLYAVEKQAKHVTAEERLTLRETQSRPTIDKLEAWLTKSLNQVPPKTAIGKVLLYLNRQWPKFRFSSWAAYQRADHA